MHILDFLNYISINVDMKYYFKYHKKYKYFLRKSY